MSLKEAVRRIKEVANIVDVIGEHVALKKVGRNYLGLCPFHADRKPSFTVNEERQIFHCFGCGAGGDVIAFYMKFHNLDFVAAVKELASRFNISISWDTKEDSLREKLFEINQKAKRFFEHLLWSSKEGEKARGYLKERGISSKVAKAFGLGFAPASYDSLASHLKLVGASLELAEQAGLLVRRTDGSFYDRFRARLIFPIYDHSGRVAGFGGRVLDQGEPKYLNSPETPVYHKGSILYGFFQARSFIREAKRGFIVEGYFDLISLFEAGVTEVLATLGTALTSHHARQLRSLTSEWYLVFDADEAGVKAALRAAPIFLNEGLFPKVITLPAGEDPDTFVRKFGAEGFRKLVEEAQDIFDFMIAVLEPRFSKTPEGRLRLFQEIKPALSAIKDPLLFELELSKLGERLGVSETALRRTFDSRSSFKVPSPKGKVYSERLVLEFLVHYPEYLSSLLEEGILEHVQNPLYRALIEKLSELENKSYADLSLEDLELQALLSEILLSPPPFDDVSPEEVYAGIKCWLFRKKSKKKLLEIRQAIKEAEKAGREEEALRLLKEYQNLCRLNL
ncbi:DNA primase [Thermodesulfatator indicus DSM 15286]|uniref:DNA primase n=1 Tax=Thermodesulfatator indicus (strain DSM 15286 / JCM 11887 / CIR29812) TaxID=667014 RepID=F8A8B6_THEID|nr:DNA primase [Thermodesulfatator indicus]AEH43920.1 DNA primase [Thermodesulfatator indicus DSM 15286]